MKTGQDAEDSRLIHQLSLSGDMGLAFRGQTLPVPLPLSQRNLNAKATAT